MIVRIRSSDLLPVVTYLLSVSDEFEISCGDESILRISLSGQRLRLVRSRGGTWSWCSLPLDVAVWWSLHFSGEDIAFADLKYSFAKFLESLYALPGSRLPIVVFDETALWYGCCHSLARYWLSVAHSFRARIQTTYFAIPDHVKENLVRLLHEHNPLPDELQVNFIKSLGLRVSEYLIDVELARTILGLHDLLNASKVLPITEVTLGIGVGIGVFSLYFRLSRAIRAQFGIGVTPILITSREDVASASDLLGLPIQLVTPKQIPSEVDIGFKSVGTVLTVLTYLLSAIKVRSRDLEFVMVPGPISRSLDCCSDPPLSIIVRTGSSDYLSRWIKLSRSLKSWLTSS